MSTASLQTSIVEFTRALDSLIRDQEFSEVPIERHDEIDQMAEQLLTPENVSKFSQLMSTVNYPGVPDTCGEQDDDVEDMYLALRCMRNSINYLARADCQYEKLVEMLNATTPCAPFVERITDPQPRIRFV